MSEVRRTYLLTRLNYVWEDVERCKRLDGYVRMILGVELCPTTGTPHLHCFVTMSKTIRQDKMLSNLPGFNIKYGDLQNAAAGWNYVNKGLVIWCDDRRNQGKRSDLNDIYLRVKDREPMKEIAENHPGSFIRYHRGIQALANAIQDYEDPYLLERFVTKVVIICGKPGIGKSEKARCIDPYAYPVMIRGDRIIWENYRGHKTILFDDFRAQINYDDLLRFTDIYPIYLDAHGKTVPRKYTEVIFTTNEIGTAAEIIRRWYPFEDHIDALLRRVTEVTIM